jgi:archaemetzincin
VDALRPLLPRLDARLGTETTVAAPLEIDDGWRKSKRRLRSGDVLDALLARASAERGDGLRLAVAKEELWAPEAGRVFGEAAVGGRCAVVGLGSLGSARRSGVSTWEARALKACVHEAAHAAGLEHCADPRCVMYPSRDMDDTDRKAPDFCARCAKAYSHATLDAS